MGGPGVSGDRDFPIFRSSFTLTNTRKSTYYYAFLPIRRSSDMVFFGVRIGQEGPVKVEQISIFLENKSGRLAEITDILARNGINIRALSLADTADFGILRLIVDDMEKTTRLLKENGFTVGTNEVVAVVLPDRPGGLAGILSALQGKNVNVEYMYAFVQKCGGNAVLIFRFDELEKAIDTLHKAGFKILKREEVLAF
jgi:hypothetical protein